MAAVRAVHALVERMLARDGPLPALCEEQRSLAGIVAEALDAPPRDEALVTLIQAATGTGKTVALLAPVMALAALQRRQGVRAHRATFSTFSNHLARQILDEDAPRVSRALEALGHLSPSSPSRRGPGGASSSTTTEWTARASASATARPGPPSTRSTPSPPSPRPRTTACSCPRGSRRTRCA